MTTGDMMPSGTGVYPTIGRGGKALGIGTGVDVAWTTRPGVAEGVMAIGERPGRLDTTAAPARMAMPASAAMTIRVRRDMDRSPHGRKAYLKLQTSNSQLHLGSESRH